MAIRMIQRMTGRCSRPTRSRWRSSVSVSGARATQRGSPRERATPTRAGRRLARSRRAGPRERHRPTRSRRGSAADRRGPARRSRAARAGRACRRRDPGHAERAAATARRGCRGRARATRPDSVRTLEPEELGDPHSDDPGSFSTSRRARSSPRPSRSSGAVFAQLDAAPSPRRTSSQGTRTSRPRANRAASRPSRPRPRQAGGPMRIATTRGLAVTNPLELEVVDLSAAPALAVQQLVVEDAEPEIDLASSALPHVARARAAGSRRRRSRARRRGRRPRRRSRRTPFACSPMYARSFATSRIGRYVSGSATTAKITDSSVTRIGSTPVTTIRKPTTSIAIQASVNRGAPALCRYLPHSQPKN